MLKKELEEDKEAELRIDRFIISDARIHFLRLVSSDSNKKIQLIKRMMNDDIWKQIKVFQTVLFSNVPTDILFINDMENVIHFIYIL